MADSAAGEIASAPAKVTARDDTCVPPCTFTAITFEPSAAALTVASTRAPTTSPRTRSSAATRCISSSRKPSKTLSDQARSRLRRSRAGTAVPVTCNSVRGPRVTR